MPRTDENLSSLIEPERHDANHTWHADVVSAPAVDKRLNALWLRLEAPRPRRLSSSASVEDAPAAEAFARTNTFNLITVARSATRAAQADAALNALGDHYPTRSIALYSDPMLDRRTAEEMSGGPLLVRTSLARARSRGQRPAHFEAVTVVGGPRAIGALAPMALSLCTPDLPTMVWWNGDLRHDLGIFRDLIEGVDRVILDSAAFGDIERGLVEINLAAARRHERHTALTDLAWTRTVDWRTLVTQYYDAPPEPGAIHAISTVTIEYGEGHGGGTEPAGHAAALLMVGWLASRLGWAPAERPSRSAGGTRLLYRAPGRAAPVVVRLVPVAGQDAATGLHAITIASGGQQPARYTIEQANPGELRTTSIIGDDPGLSRHVMMSPVGDVALLDDAFRAVGLDEVYLEAVAAIAAILTRR